MPNRQALDPTLRQFLDEQAATAPNLPAMADPERTEAHRAALLRARRNREGIEGLPNNVTTRQVTVANDRPARLYIPDNAKETPKPLLVYLHGGGWVAGSLDTVDPFCKLL